ncbi:MAG TPA: tetratricopeptide repeat protein [Pyrinomonadaceae bacterium]|nr:tetratricopeptide repeat protein [Pyrinomonadaceae bacterium]
MFRPIVSPLIVTAFLALCACPVLAQQITGQVRYTDTGQAAFNLIVKCDGTGARSEVFTDRSGNFRFNVTPGHYTVSIHMPGYIAEERSVDLVDNFSSEYIFFRLKPDGAGTKPLNSNPAVGPNVPPAAQEEFEKAEAALASEKKESVEEGVQHLEKAISIYPKFVQALLRIGTAYMDLAQWDKAEQALKKTVEIDPKAANAYFALSEVYLRQKKYDQAEKAIQDGLAIETHSAQSHLTLARVYWEKVAGVKEEAQWRPSLEKSYQKVNQALQLDANLAAAHLLKGNLLFKVRRAEDALHEYEEYLRLDPQGQSAEQTRTLADKIRKALAQEKKP